MPTALLLLTKATEISGLQEHAVQDVTSWGKAGCACLFKDRCTLSKGSQVCLDGVLQSTCLVRRKLLNLHIQFNLPCSLTVTTVSIRPGCS